jgi:hypothetical protein
MTEFLVRMMNRTKREQGVLMSSSVTERRRARAAPQNFAAAAEKHEPRIAEPLTPRHALEHLTTLRPRRLREAWLTAPAVGEAARCGSPQSVDD